MLSSSYYSVIMRDQPSAYYRLGETSGTTANDSGKNAYNGTLNGGVTLSASGAIVGDSNAAMTLNGSTGYIALASGLNPGGAGSLSVEAWIKTSGITGTGRVLANDHTDVNNIGFQFALSNSGGFFGLGFSSYQVGANFTGTFNTGVWIHIVGTWDGTTIRLYVNGAANGTASVGGSLASSSNAINIGRNPAYNGDYYTGSVDEVAIWIGKTLTADQIKRHYQAGIGGQVARRKAIV